MELTAFPPADALIQQLLKIEYKKHLNNLITVILTIAAVIYVLVQKFAEWYQNGGKNALLQIAIKVWNFLTICYLWVRVEGYPQLIKFIETVKQTYADWKGLVTVA